MRKIALAAALAVLGVLLVAPPASAEYEGARWYDSTKTICVDTTKVDSSAARAAMHEAIRDMRERTKLKLTISASSTCKSRGYGYRVEVYDYYLGGPSSCFYGCTDFPGDFTWKSSLKGPWGTGTWVFKSPVRIKLNLSKLNDLSAGRKSSVASHELGHAVGLDHNSRCASVMQASMSGAVNRGCTIYRNLTWRDRVGYWSSDPGINLIYRYG
jgi:hypothetical protein